ncbi:hypothetical protein BC826DRAFT_448789 [Russula brevipes]|nr:hypothetical protein BC826DRAFT_448789 [Russula brevipes]
MTYASQIFEYKGRTKVVGVGDKFPNPLTLVGTPHANNALRTARDDRVPLRVDSARIYQCLGARGFWGCEGRDRIGCRLLRGTEKIPSKEPDAIQPGGVDGILNLRGGGNVDVGVGYWSLRGGGCVGRLAAGGFALAGFAEVGGAEGGGRSVGIVECVGGGLNLSGTGGEGWGINSGVGRRWGNIGVGLASGGTGLDVCCSGVVRRSRVVLGILRVLPWVGGRS